jgi:hypothetical protein
LTTKAATSAGQMRETAMKPISTFFDFLLRDPVVRWHGALCRDRSGRGSKGNSTERLRNVQVESHRPWRCEQATDDGDGQSQTATHCPRAGRGESVFSAATSQGLLQRGERSRSGPPQTSRLCPPSRRAQGEPSAEVVVAGPGTNRRTGALL